LIEKRSELLAEKGAPDSIQNIIRSIDIFVNTYGHISHKIESDKNKNKEDEEEFNKRISILIEEITGFIKEMEKLQEGNEFVLLSRYYLVLKKYGWNQDIYKFASTKCFTINDIIEMGDDLLSVHFQDNNNNNSNDDILRSHLLWKQ
ncbi:hypothetical protein RFI_06408, partial [Reticulomyxa filosa]